MMRWVVRLGLAGILVALAAYAWTLLNQEDDEEELEDEIPIEFDVPLDVALAPSTGALTSTNGHDTGVGPGEDRQAGSSDEEVPSAKTQPLAADADGMEEPSASVE